MSQSKKFIITSDESIRNLLVASGFYLLSDVGGKYTFANINHVNFNFNEIDVSKMVYTNMIAI